MCKWAVAISESEKEYAGIHNKRTIEWIIEVVKHGSKAILVNFFDGLATSLFDWEFLVPKWCVNLFHTQLNRIQCWLTFLHLGVTCAAASTFFGIMVQVMVHQVSSWLTHGSPRRLSTLGTLPQLWNLSSLRHYHHFNCKPTMSFYKELLELILLFYSERIVSLICIQSHSH